MSVKKDIKQNIKRGDVPMSHENYQAENLNMDNADWSEESLEFLFDNKIWQPGFVRL